MLSFGIFVVLFPLNNSETIFFYLLQMFCKVLSAVCYMYVTCTTTKIPLSQHTYYIWYIIQSGDSIIFIVLGTPLSSCIARLRFETALLYKYISPRILLTFFGLSPWLFIVIQLQCCTIHWDSFTSVIFPNLKITLKLWRFIVLLSHSNSREAITIFILV